MYLSTEVLAGGPSPNEWGCDDDGYSCPKEAIRVEEGPINIGNLCYMNRFFGGTVNGDELVV